jgi:hypothetical protein
MNGMKTINRQNWLIKHSFKGVYLSRTRTVPSIEELNTERPTLFFFLAPTKTLQSYIYG